MVQTPILPPTETLYPDSDGQPMAENTVQYRWIVRLVSNLKRLLQSQTAFVAGDLLWYPVRVNPKETPPSQAPDALVVFGRPDGDRGSYKQWVEDDIAPQVVFEILSPSNTTGEMFAKQMFYMQHGVLEMYFYNPDSQDFWAFVRSEQEQEFQMIMPLNLPWTSPLLQIRFELFDDGLAMFHPDGEPFKDPVELFEERDMAQQECDRAQQERDMAQQECDRLAAKLRELGVDPTTLTE